MESRQATWGIRALHGLERPLLEIISGISKPRTWQHLCTVLRGSALGQPSPLNVVVPVHSISLLPMPCSAHRRQQHPGALDCRQRHRVGRALLLHVLRHQDHQPQLPNGKHRRQLLPHAGEGGGSMQVTAAWQLPPHAGKSCFAASATSW